MKKQIALLATLIAASGFTALGQDWITFNITGSKDVWQDTASSGNEPATGLYDVALLWAATGQANPLTDIGTKLSDNDAAAGGNTTAEVATNGVASISASVLTTVQGMLSTGGWAIAKNINSGLGTGATGLAISALGAKGAVNQYDVSGGTASEFEIQGGTGVSASHISMIAFAFNPSAVVGGQIDWADVTSFGYSDDFVYEIGANAGDGNGTTSQNASGMNQFGVAVVAPVPEPTTLALAGLGGLSMLFLRRRKA